MEKQTAYFKLGGLSKNKSITCETKGENHFWPKINMEQDRFDALWKFCEGDWSSPKFCEIEYDRLDKTGEPINPVLLNIVTEVPKSSILL